MSISSYSEPKENKQEKQNNKEKKIVNNKYQTSTKPTIKNVKKESLKRKKLVSKSNSKNNSNSSSNVINKAKFIRQTPPSYPQRSIELGQEGSVIIHVFLEKSGNPKEFKLINSSGFRLLDLAALEAVKKWEFAPINKGQQIISGWVQVPIRFTLN